MHPPSGSVFTQALMKRKNPMAGILLYTAAGDSDGTLGGLVRLGRPGTLERIVQGALKDARWCGSDPICVESRGQGPDSLNLAACHTCSLLPETSCEFQNLVLDKRAVQQYFATDVPTQLSNQGLSNT